MSVSISKRDFPNMLSVSVLMEPLTRVHHMKRFSIGGHSNMYERKDWQHKSPPVVVVHLGGM